jgi:hypothetical protein
MENPTIFVLDPFLTMDHYEKIKRLSVIFNIVYIFHTYFKNVTYFSCNIMYQLAVSGLTYILR